MTLGRMTGWQAHRGDHLRDLEDEVSFQTSFSLCYRTDKTTDPVLVGYYDLGDGDRDK